MHSKHSWLCKASHAAREVNKLLYMSAGIRVPSQILSKPHIFDKLASKLHQRLEHFRLIFFSMIKFTSG